MAYQIYYDGALLYDQRGQAGLDPDDETYAVYDASLHIGVGIAGELTFTVAAGHPYINVLEARVSPIKVTETTGSSSETIFLGRIIRVRQNLDNSRTFTCEGRLACLNDAAMPPYAFPDNYVSDAAYQAAVSAGTVPAYWLGKLLELHNSMAWTADKQIRLGTVTVTGSSLTRSSEEWRNMWEVISGDLPDSPLGGYLVPRYDGDTMYLDYLAEFTEENGQAVTFSENLIDYAEEMDSSGYFNAVIPLGEDGLTCAAAPNGAYGPGGKYYKSGQYLVTPGARDAGYGNVVRVVQFDGITAAADLVSAAVSYLDTMRFPLVGDVSAADLSGVDGTTPSFRIAKLLRIDSPPQGVQTTYPIMGLTIDLLGGVETQLTLDGKSATISGASSSPSGSYSSGAIVAGVRGVKGDAESAYRTGDVNLTPANIGALPQTGGTISGNLSVSGAVHVGGGVSLWTDNEGGNIQWLAPNGEYNQIDSYDNTHTRIFTFVNGAYYEISWRRADNINLSAINDAVGAMHSNGADIHVGSQGVVHIREIEESGTCRGAIDIRNYSTGNRVLNAYALGSTAELDINWSDGTVRAALLANSASGGVLTLASADGSARASLNYDRLRTLRGVTYDNQNKTTYRFSVSRNDATAFAYFLLFGGDGASNPFVYHGFVDTSGNGNGVTLTPIFNPGSNPTLTATYDGSTLTITGSSTMWGGVRLIWIN